MVRREATARNRERIASSEDAQLAQRRNRREERRRRERARLRRQRLAVTVIVGTLLLACTGAATAWALLPEPTRVVRVQGVVAGDDDGAAACSAVVGRIAKKAPRALKPPPPPGPKPLKPAPGERVIVVDKGDQRVTLYDAKGKVVAHWPCASGVYYPRVGTYQVTSRKPQSYYPADGSRFTYFTIFTKSEKNTNIGFHAIPTIDGEQVPGGLGKPISHGCVRLEEKNAKYLYEWAPNGTEVRVQS